jgi:hypothetical protein
MKWFACLAALAVTAPVLADPIYKWVDEKGVTQFTQTPPPPSANKVDKLDVRVPAGTPRAESAPASTPAVPDKTAAAVTDPAKQRADRCRQAHAALDKLNSSEPIVTIDPKLGKQAVADEDRPKHIAQVKKVIAQQCDDAAQH